MRHSYIGFSKVGQGVLALVMPRWHDPRAPTHRLERLGARYVFRLPPCLHSSEKRECWVVWRIFPWASPKGLSVDRPTWLGLDFPPREFIVGQPSGLFIPDGVAWGFWTTHVVLTAAQDPMQGGGLATRPQRRLLRGACARPMMGCGEGT